MAWPQKGRYSDRKGAKRLPESQRRRLPRRYPNCQLAIIGVCTRYSVEIHHAIDAADNGPDTDFLPDGTKQLVGVCRECHRWVSARRSAARAKAAQNRRRTAVKPPEPIPFRSFADEMPHWL